MRFLATQKIIESVSKSFAEWMFNSVAKKMQDAAFKIRPEWKLSPAPSLNHSVPIISDEIIRALEDGGVDSVTGIGAVVGPNEVELVDGTRLQVDCIIFCTGYKSDFSILDSTVDPTRNTTPRWGAAPGSRGKPLPRLYQNIISLDYPESLAIMGSVAFASAAFQLYDLASMALAQIWKGNSYLPSKREMENAVDKHHDWICSLAEQGNVFPGLVKHHDWLAWADRSAGTGVDRYLGWGWHGWKFWILDRELCSVVMGGILSPHIYRLFDGKRKKWAEARVEIERVNKSINEKPKAS
jgi:dimethylaniline monooxygenase (N-oxide forming)